MYRRKSKRKPAASIAQPPDPQHISQRALLSTNNCSPDPNIQEWLHSKSRLISRQLSTSPLRAEDFFYLLNNHSSTSQLIIIPLHHQRSRLQTSLVVIILFMFHLQLDCMKRLSLAKCIIIYTAVTEIHFNTPTMQKSMKKTVSHNSMWLIHWLLTLEIGH